MNIKKGIRDVLKGDSTVEPLCARYNFRSGDEAAIFTTQVFPERTQYPAVIIRQIDSGTFGVRANRGSEVFVDVAVYDNKDHSDLALTTLADAVWDALDRQTVTVSGYCNCLLQADAPVESPDEDGFIGYVIRCRVLMLAND